MTQVFPTGVDSCTFHTHLLTRAAPPSADADAYWDKAWRLTTSVNDEDCAVIESIQRSYAHMEPGDEVLHGRFEQRLTHFYASCERFLKTSG